MEKEIKNYKLCKAVIYENDKFLIFKRGPKGNIANKWEFIGGKIEQYQTVEDNVIREVLEETGSKVDILDKIGIIDYSYDIFRLVMHVYLVKINKGLPQRIEHEDMKWVSLDEIFELDLAKGDLEIAYNLNKYFKGVQDE